MKLVVGTRGSKLALAQTNEVIKLLTKKFPELEFEKKLIKTTGDKILDSPLAKIPGKGLFVKEIDEAVESGKVDFAIHSMKDVPIELHKNLEIVSVPKRHPTNDVLISRSSSIDKLRKNAIVGTSSIRRKAEILNYRCDLIVKDVRGNVDTRIKKLNEYDAILMAEAGLRRLNLEKLIAQRLPLEAFPPSVGQGAVAVVARSDFEHNTTLASINDEKSMQCIRAERALLKSLGGGCQMPLGVLTKASVNLKLRGIVFSPDGKKRIEAAASGKPEDAEAVGAAAGEKLLDNGAGALLP